MRDAGYETVEVLAREMHGPSDERADIGLRPLQTEKKKSKNRLPVGTGCHYDTESTAENQEICTDVGNPEAT